MINKLFIAVFTSFLGGGWFLAYNDIQEKKQLIQRMEKSIFDFQQESMEELSNFSKKMDRETIKQQELRILEQQTKIDAHQKRLAALSKQLSDKDEEIAKLNAENEKVVAQEKHLCQISHFIIAGLKEEDSPTAEKECVNAQKNQQLVQ